MFNPPSNLFNSPFFSLGCLPNHLSFALDLEPIKLFTMKNLLALVSILFLTISMNAQEPIAGIYNMGGKDNTQIEIAEASDGIYEGKIIASDNTDAKIGATLLKDIKLVDGEWRGKLFAAKKRKWMDTVLKAEENQLLVTVNAGIMSKTLKWTKG